MAIEPKTPRKRAVKKTSAKAEAKTTEVTTEEPKKATRKKAAIPVPVFQAAPDKPVAKTVRKKAEVAEAPAADAPAASRPPNCRSSRPTAAGRARAIPTPPPGQAARAEALGGTGAR